MIDYSYTPKQNIIRELDKKGISYRDFAEIIGLSYGGAYKIIMGMVKPSIGVAYRIAKLLGRSIEYLFFEGTK